MSIELPDPIYGSCSIARQAHRSVSQQATIMLAEALGVTPEPRDRRRNLVAHNLDAMQPPEKLIRD